MSESFLHYLWQFQYFDKRDLQTVAGEPIQVFHTGHRNTHAGPDFLNALIRIGNVSWAGHVEIHTEASLWTTHHHDTDAAYDNVVLHVVWRNDKPVNRKDGSLLPVLELKGRVDDDLFLRYKKLINAPYDVPCSASLEKVSTLTLYSMLDKTLAVRLEHKTNWIALLLRRNNNDWEETCYQLLARNFGFKVNAESFLRLAQAIPYKTLMRHADKPQQLEACILGVAGFLADPETNDDYTAVLKREYKILGQKYSLMEYQLNKVHWKFLRLRPANFPTIRLMQFASLLCHQKNIFSRIVQAETFPELKKIFAVQQSVYWRHHYQLGKLSAEEVAPLGEASVENILINSVVPLLAAYGKLKDDQRHVDRALAILQELPMEMNAIIRRWRSLNIKSKTAFDSQALLELYTGFCSKRRCLDCTIGTSLLKPV